VEQESRLLLEKGHEVQIMIFDNKVIQGFFPKIKAAFQGIYSFGSARKVARILKQFRPDVIHIHNLFFIASPSVLFIASRYRIPVVLTIHNYRLICSNAHLLRNNQVCELCVQKKFPIYGIRYKCYRNSAAETAFVTAITGTHKLLNTWKKKIAVYIALNEFSKFKLLNSSLQISEKKIVTKPNFILDPGEEDRPREDFFLFVGRIVKEKGIHVLLEAFAGMPGNKLVVIGDGSEKESLRNQYRPYDNIYFSGHAGKHVVLETMRRCKAFICPSLWYEGSPLTIIEAFATGTPVIASKLGSMAESIKDGYNGFHFIAGDVKDLKEKVEYFTKQISQSPDLYKNARQTYKDKYHPDIHYKSVINIYNNVVSGLYNHV
jgi:glycosyltransferase involved in cell wall biosynthesis